MQTFNCPQWPGLGSNTYSYLYLYSTTPIFVFVFVFEKHHIGVFVFVFVFERCIWTYLKNIFQIQLQFWKYFGRIKQHWLSGLVIFATEKLNHDSLLLWCQISHHCMNLQHKWQRWVTYKDPVQICSTLIYACCKFLAWFLKFRSTFLVTFYSFSK